MLLEDAGEPALAGRRERLEKTLAAARQALVLINAALGSARGAGAGDVAGLYDSLREPQGRIIQAVSGLLSSEDASDAALHADLKKILAAAERLVPGNGALAASASPDQAPHPAPTVAAAVPKARILVVDDGAENRDVLCRRLEREGHAVESAENGRRALDLVAQRPFDLVLLDVLMPELDGYAVLDALKGNPATRDIPVIMISALDELPGIVRCIERGAEDYLHKPFDPVLLRARINASLEKKRLRDQEVEYLHEVNRVIEAAAAVEEGKYRPGALAEVTQRADELGHLARVFDSMAHQTACAISAMRSSWRDVTPRRTRSPWMAETCTAGRHSPSATRSWPYSGGAGWERCTAPGTASWKRKSPSRRYDLSSYRT
jgi:CheY-like chemotaxis protein